MEILVVILIGVVIISALSGSRSRHSEPTVIYVQTEPASQPSMGGVVLFVIGVMVLLALLSSL